MSARKIGILGGTFDPIHKGHINLALEALKQLDLNAVLFIPNNIPPHKEYDDFKDNNIHRMNMLKIALENYPMLQISDIELRKEGKSYTYETLALLNKIFKNDELYFIMGDDSFFAFHTWKNPAEICKYATLVVAKRQSVRDDFMKRQKLTLENTYNAQVVILEDNIVEASSTEIRNLEDDNSQIPEEVLEYIKTNHLYNY